MIYRIENATWRDLKDLHRLEKTCFEQDAWPLLDLLAVLTFPSTVRLKAVVEEKMVGFVGGDPRTRDRVGWINTIAVLPEYRGQGIATAMLLSCEQQMMMPRIRLCVRRSNLTAQRLYLRLGYDQVEVWKKYYVGKEDALVFEKIVDS